MGQHVHIPSRAQVHPKMGLESNRGERGLLLKASDQGGPANPASSGQARIDAPKHT